VVEAYRANLKSAGYATRGDDEGGVMYSSGHWLVNARLDMPGVLMLYAVQCAGGCGLGHE
jgi:hypothetical protein